MQYWKKYRYKNLTFFCFSVIFAIIISQLEVFHSFLIHLGTWGYIGAFLAGILFVSTFTVATGALILLVLAESLSPIEIGLIAGLGAVVGDALIFHFVKDDLVKELKPLYHKLGGDHVTRTLHTPYFS